MDKRGKRARKSLPTKYPIQIRNQATLVVDLNSEHVVPYEVIKQDMTADMITVKCSYCCKMFDSIDMHKEHHCKRLKDFLQNCLNCDKSYVEHELNPENNASYEKQSNCKLAVDEPDKAQVAYQCCICQKTFPDLFATVRHIKYHVTRAASRKAEMYCGQCGKGFATKQQLSKHGTVHTDQRPFQCEMCQKCFKTAETVKRHMVVHTDDKPFLCATCGKYFRSKHMLRKHAETHSDLRLYECPHCDKTYKAKNTLRDHLRVHNGQRPYKCQQCDQAFYRPSHLTTHNVVHSKARPFACKDCDKKFGRKEHLKVHERIHSGEKPFKCTLCERSFNQQAGLQAHLASHSEQRPHPCTKCNKSFKYSSQIKHHACKPEVGHSMVQVHERMPDVDIEGSHRTECMDPVAEPTPLTNDCRGVEGSVADESVNMCLGPAETIILIQIQNADQHMQHVLNEDLSGTSQLIGDMRGTHANRNRDIFTHNGGNTVLCAERSNTSRSLLNTELS